ncbi:MAG: hypothetical protein WC510_08175 [Candidatus Omnitrophota bacterium]
MLCKKCLLPEQKPNIYFNNEGICNICLTFEKNRSLNPSNKFLESEFIKIVNKYKGKNKYDCLVMCSGGKDSTLALYYIKRRYKMNPLAFTFDHGFENEDALANIRNAVEILGVDWLYFKSDFMKDIFALIINHKRNTPICHICAIWYLQLTHEIASRYNIPLVVAGWTKGQSLEGADSGLEYAAMSEATSSFVTEYLHSQPQYRGFPKSIKEVVEKSQKRFKTLKISPHWFLGYDPAKAMEILERELNWQKPEISYPADSTNCLMNFASVYLSMEHYGYTHYHIELSKLIRLGELSRQEAMRILEVKFDREFVNSILSRIGCRLG